MGVTREIKRMLNAFAGDMSRRELQDILHLKDDEHFRSACMKPAIEQKLIAGQFLQSRAAANKNTGSPKKASPCVTRNNLQ